MPTVAGMTRSSPNRYTVPQDVTCYVKRNSNRNANVTWSGLPPKSNGFFRGPCTTFPPSSVVPFPFGRICFVLLVMWKGGESSWSGPGI